MAFNLNKNDGSQQNDPTHKSKFDLSKNESSDDGASSKKPPYWIFILLALVILGGAAWYFTSRNTNGDVVMNDSTSSSANKDIVAVGSAQSPASVTPDSVAARAVISVDSSSDDKHISEKITENTQGTTQTSSEVAASFNKGSSSFAKISPSVVNNIVKLSKTNGTISVNGYASSEGDLAVNLKISQMRADSFKKYLVSKGVSENRITAIGKGIDNPIASNDTEAGRRKNRRVEIIIQ